MKRIPKKPIGWLLASGLLLGGAAWAAPVTITNPGFEDPPTADGGLGAPGVVPGWSVFNLGAIRVLNPSSAADLTAEAPEGQNVGLLTGSTNEDGYSQTLTSSLQADADYVLTVKVANTKFTVGFPGYRVQLLANGTLLAEDDNSQSVAEDAVATSTVSYSYTVADAALVGQALEIRLLSKGLVDGQEVAFDDVQLDVTLLNPVANPGGPYTVGIGGSLSLDGSASQPSDGQAITLYEWDLDDDGVYDITGVTPTAISDADLQATYGMGYGDNTIVLRVTDDSSPTPKTATAAGTVTLAPPIAGQLGVLNLTANGGINPNTGNPWQVGDKYRLAFHTNGTTITTSNDPEYYNDFATSEAWTVAALKGVYWRAMVTVNLDPTTTQALSPKSEARANTGTGDLTGGFAQGGAGEPVYVVNGTTCIARNNADIWNTWSNPFENAAGVPNTSGTGNNVVRWAAGTGPAPASQPVHYSPFLNQNGAQTVNPDNIHGKDIATGCNTDGSHVNALGNTTDNTTINRGNSNANSTGRVWNRFTDATTAARSLYVISVPLTIIDLTETVAPTLLSFEDDRSGADLFLGTGSVVYTVSFSEAINAETLTTDDFENGGSSAVTIDSIRGTIDPTMFKVTVTPTSAGTLQLRVKAAAVIADPVGNELDAGAAGPDDTIITVIEDNTAPTLVSIADNVSGGPVVATKLSTPTYLVTFDEAIKPSSIGTDDFENGGTAGVTINSVSPTGDPAVFQVVVTTSSVGTLVLQIVSGAVIEDLAGNPLDTAAPLPDDTTIAVNPVPELAGELGVLDVVNANAGINPATGQPWAAGDTYRLVFITSQTTDAQSADIATYNAFVQGVAAASTTYPDLGNGQWKIMGSTVAVDARDNTGTNPATDGTGVPIFLADGVRKVADDNADLWNGNIDTAIDVDENGQSFVIPNLFSGGVFTGSFADGTSVGDSGGDVALGVDTTPAEVSGVQTGTNFVNNVDPPIPATDGRWFRVWKADWTAQRSAYAISDVLTVQSTASGTPYATWAGGPFLGTLSDPSPALDFDAGGLETGLEWVLGGDPTDGSDDAGIAPTFDNTTDPDFFIFTYRRADAAAADANTAIKVEYGSGLDGWTEAVAGADIVITPDDDGAAVGIDLVEVKIRRTLAVDGKLFVRLNVVVTTP
jgi:hypothetical protein